MLIGINTLINCLLWISFLFFFFYLSFYIYILLVLHFVFLCFTSTSFLPRLSACLSLAWFHRPTLTINFNLEFLDPSCLLVIDFDEFLAMYRRLFVNCCSVVSHDISDMVPASPKKVCSASLFIFHFDLQIHLNTARFYWSREWFDFVAYTSTNM